MTSVYLGDLVFYLGHYLNDIGPKIRSKVIQCLHYYIQDIGFLPMGTCLTAVYIVKGVRFPKIDSKVSSFFSTCCRDIDSLLHTRYNRLDTIIPKNNNQLCKRYSLSH